MPFCWFCHEAAHISLSFCIRLNDIWLYLCIWDTGEYNPQHEKKQQTDMCAQRRLRSAWASAHSDQSLRCPQEESLGPYLLTERLAKTLIRTGGCPGWSESSLGSVILLVLSWGGSYYVTDMPTIITGDVCTFCYFVFSLTDKLKTAERERERESGGRDRRRIGGLKEKQT